MAERQRQRQRQRQSSESEQEKNERARGRKRCTATLIRGALAHQAPRIFVGASWPIASCGGTASLILLVSAF
eukprot:scaffold57076_cov66-Phaeocystis_antarctica.AAC.4